MTTPEIISEYQKTYMSLYRRAPTELRELGDNWILVNGARMTVSELQQLTQQLKKELEEVRAAKRSVIKRLVKWFSAPTN